MPLWYEQFHGAGRIILQVKKYVTKQSVSMVLYFSVLSEKPGLVSLILRPQPEYLH